ncbi:ArsR family transcriptional regulator [Pseudonocardia sp. DSM 110487]|uniref:arsenate reductase/protein-tyrosine-phosphatase family protein n=1 Tax=Pseudonocardia sp. DSM 110487 TaxID=2865833 RepID=UPI001C69636D|nr:ArsR family transcriptional regulator [Pseudonocardia sp. DSM 110487]QYN40491.1 ArsR family transcriptional regulator [Pseudonocardia sp. DSM 110487]
MVADPPAFVRLAAHPVRWRLLSALAGSDYRVRELVALVGEPQNLVSYHLKLLRDGGLATVTRSSFDGRDSYYHLDLDRCGAALAESAAALHPALRRDVAPTIPGGAVLFVCTGNSARSPIAEALLRRHTGARATVTSAGSRPRPELHPHTVRVLREEFGVDVSGQRPRHLDSLAGRTFDWVVTMCDKAREVCPDFGRTRRVHWSIPEPADDAAAFRRTAAEIDTRVRYLLPALGTANREEARR